MKTDERARMRQTLGEAVRRAVVPGRSTGDAGTAGGRSGSARPPVAADALVAGFRRELEALAGVVHEVSGPDEARACVQTIARDLGATRAIAWRAAELGVPGVIEALEQSGIRALVEALPAEPRARAAALAELEPAELGVTGADAGLADTGSIVLASGPGRLRLASLLPPVHVALLPRARLWPTLGAWLAAESALVERASNVVVITGPSRTADIEMTLSRGVHGPGELFVVVY